MKSLLIDARYNKPLKINQDTLDEIKKHKRVALYAAVQFIHLLPDIKKQLETVEGVEVVTSKPDRTDANYQILGCDCYWQNYQFADDIDAFVYIGDGFFHPLAMALAQRDTAKYRPVIIYDPKDDKKILIDLERIAPILRRYRSSLMKFKNADIVGVFVTTKPGQQQYKMSLKLKEKFPDKKFYYFAGDNFDYAKTEEFPFCKFWINTACPRIGLDDQVNYKVDTINLMDAFDVDKILSKDCLLTRI
ncbi:diphthamide synthesis protein [Candidatus Woesearchaeota archaeon]|nr:diphthamide synthesis protein [Candidatus Woesearchaeota archaeon]